MIDFSLLKTLEDSILFSDILDSDSYKTTHWLQYPPGTTRVVSYMESRGGLFPETVQFGFLYHLKRYFAGVVITNEMIDAAKTIIVEHMGGDLSLFNEKGWRYIANEKGGKLPLKIKILPEGYRVGVHNALAVVTNTDDQCYWLVNYAETMLLRAWYSISVATLSYEIGKVIKEYLELSGTPALLDFMLQDFGSRGTSCREQSMIGGMAHLVNFKGTDTMIALAGAIKYYNASTSPGFSVPASEHSTMTSWGKDLEVSAVENMLDQYPTGIVSIVGDSFDIFNFCENIIGTFLHDKVINRKGVVVIRPDSADGVKYTTEGVILKIFEILSTKFGFTVNDKGFKVLPPFIRVLQGDGMNIHSLRSLCRTVTDAGWSVDNFACFGMGGKLLMSVDRDTQKFAFKCCAIKIGNEWREVFKDPITDPGKTSQRGIPAVYYSPTKGFKTMTSGQEWQYGDRLVTVFENGEIVNEWNFEQIRENVNEENYSILISEQNGR